MLQFAIDQRPQRRHGIGLVLFKKNFTKVIAPVTISSQIKQTVLYCYQMSDEDAVKLHQVKTNDESFCGF